MLCVVCDVFGCARISVSQLWPIFAMPINLPKMGGKANSSRSVDPATETINKYFDSAIGCSLDYPEATAEWLATIVDGDENNIDLQHPLPFCATRCSRSARSRAGSFAYSPNYTTPT